jgi:hypothetical protein
MASPNLHHLKTAVTAGHIPLDAVQLNNNCLRPKSTLRVDADGATVTQLTDTVLTLAALRVPLALVTVPVCVGFAGCDRTVTL